MNANSAVATGTLLLNRAIRNDEDALEVTAALADLPGVREVQLTRTTAYIRFDPEVVDEQKFFEAVKHVDFHATTFERKE
jgi:copper chaperone CopZ